MFTKRNVILVAVIVCALLVLTTPWNVIAGDGIDDVNYGDVENSWPLDGIWVSAVPTPLGNLILTTTYVAQDAAKTRYSGSLEEINPLPLLMELYPDGDIDKWAGGQAVIVGLNKYEATYLGYSLKARESNMEITEIVGLWTIKAHFELVGPDRLEGYGNGSYYLAAQDADQDGFPDEGQEPIACIPWTWTGKRLTPMPGCELPPMPEPGQ
jgi:hypothetical protein